MKFDIILPTIGRDNLINAIDSVLRQEHTDWHLWIVTDGLGEFPNSGFDHRISVISNNDPLHNDYGAWARNTGISLGSSEWIAYIDDDDIWLPNHLQVMKNMATENPAVNMMRTAGQAFFWKHKSPRSSKLIRKLGAVNSEDILTVGICHKRSLFYMTNGWQPCDNHDKILWNEMQSHGGIETSTETITFEFER